MQPNIVNAPEGYLGLIILPRGKDFIIMDDTRLDNISVLEVCLNEMKDISKGTMSARAGAAGGLMIPSGTSKSLSPITKNERLMLMRKNSVGMSLTYRNKDENVKGRSSIYHDLYMKRYSSNQKLCKNLTHSPGN